MSAGDGSRAGTPWVREFFLLSGLWGASFLFMRLGASEFGPFPTAGLRVALATLFLWPILVQQGQWPQLRQHWRPVLLAGLINSAIPFALYAWAVLHITTGLASILNATVPLFGAVIAWLWLKDRPNGSRILGLAIGFMGVALLASEKASFKPDASGMSTGWAVLACLLACLCYGISASFTKRYLSGLPPLVTATGSQLGATLGLLLPSLWLWPSQAPSAPAWLALIAVGVLCTGLAYILFFRLIEQAGPARALAVTFVIPVFGVMYGVVLLGESVTPWMVLCGLVIVCGTALSAGLVTLPKRKS